MPQANPVQLQRAMQGMAFPVNKDDLLRNARSVGAEDEVVQSLERLDEQEFRAPSDVVHAVGGLSDRRD
jgi:hypothetical protein